jgi:hypothetical protein
MKAVKSPTIAIRTEEPEPFQEEQHLTHRADSVCYTDELLCTRRLYRLFQKCSLCNRRKVSDASHYYSSNMQ